MSKPKLMFWIPEDWYFWSHRSGLARAARDAGWDVALATRVHEHGERIRDAGIELHPLSMQRRITAPWKDARSIAHIAYTYRAVGPDIVHQVGMKQILYGSFASRLVGVPGLVNAFAGMGSMFIGGGLKKQVVKSATVAGFRAVLGHPNTRVIFQNDDDRRELVGLGITTFDRTTLIRGSGVDTSQFAPTPLPEGPPLFLLPARMLWDKGVGEFVEAARILRAQGVNARFVLVGNVDRDNPAHIDEAQLKAWVAEGTVEWWGRRSDMVECYAKATAVVLPSYREGLPKALLEGAACGRPVIAADVIGCREVARHEVNGLLVAVKDAQKLAGAMARIAADPELARRYGEAGRKLVVEELSEQHVIQATLQVYEELLARRPASHSQVGWRRPASGAKG